MSAEAGGIEAADIHSGPRTFDRNMKKLKQVEAETGSRPPHCRLCLKMLTSKNSNTAWTDDAENATSLSSTPFGKHRHPVKLGPSCWRKLVKAEKEYVQRLRSMNAEMAEGLTNSNILFSDEEAAPLPQREIMSWGDAVQKYGLSPLEQDDFLCFLRAHGHPTGQLSPDQYEVMHGQWHKYRGPQMEAKISRSAGQLPFDALVEGYHLGPGEQENFLSFLEDKGFRTTTRLPVLEALYYRFRKGV